MKKSLLLASAMLASVSAFAATDGHTYEAKNGLTCYNRWTIDNKHTGTFNTETLPFVEFSDRVRTATIYPEKDLILFGYSKPLTAPGDSAAVNTAHIASVSLIDGSGYKETLLTCNGEMIRALLCINTIGVDNFGHIWFCGYSATTSTSPVKLYKVDNFETGECSLITELLLPAEEAATADGRMDYASLIGDITGENAPCTVMWALSNNFAQCHRWVRDQGEDEWYGGFDGFVSLEKDFETYPADVIWNTAPSVTMILDDEYSGSMFYVDGNNTCPSLYDASGAMLESFAFDTEGKFTPNVAPNGVGEFSFGDDMYMVYAVNQPNAGVTSAELRAVKLGEGGTFEGMEELWMLPAENGLGDTNDGVRYHAIVTKEFIDDNGKKGYYLLSFKCKNGVAVYTIAEEGFVDPNPIGGVEGIVADEIDANAPVEYYNIQGMKIEKPENGLFIKVQGNKATKVAL